MGFAFLRLRDGEKKSGECVMSVRFRVCLVAWIAVVVVFACCRVVNADTYDVGNGLTMEITPALKVSATSTAAVEPTDVSDGEGVESNASVSGPAAESQPAVVVPSAYTRVYRSIPFNRAEYDANPSYRHDATMEILTGNPRHQTILHHSTVPAPARNPVSTPKYLNDRLRRLNYFFPSYPGIYYDRL